MAYRFQAGEAVPQAVGRIVSGEIDSAVGGLASPSPSQRDGAIHETRKSLKKIRGLLRLLRPRLGSTFRQENKRLRRIGRNLSPLRDAAALLELVEHLLQEHPAALPAKSAAALRRGLARDKADLEHEFSASHVVESTSRALTAAGKRSRQWSVDKKGFPALAPGLELTYRAGRKALRVARQHDDPEHYHQLRKRVKDHWYHVRLLGGISRETMHRREASLRELETALGDDHNLAVLDDKLRQTPQRYGGMAALAPFLSLVAQKQAKLRKNSLALAQRLYRQKPRAFTTRMAALWRAWQRTAAATGKSSAAPRARSVATAS